MNYGTVDYSSPLAPKEIRLGIVGTNETVEGVSGWFEKCRNEIPAKESKQPNLFPKFPGFRPDVAFQSSVILDRRLQRAIRYQAFKDLSKEKNTNHTITKSVDLFLEELDYLTTNTKVDVLICAIPKPCRPDESSTGRADLDEAPTESKLVLITRQTRF